MIVIHRVVIVPVQRGQQVFGDTVAVAVGRYRLGMAPQKLLNFRSVHARRGCRP